MTILISQLLPKKSTINLMVSFFLITTIPTSWAQNDDTVNLNFDNTSIVSIAKTMGVISNRNIVVDSDIKGELTLITNKPVTVTEAWNQFISALRLKKLTIFESGGIYKIVSEQNAKLQSATVVSQIKKNKENQVATKIFKLNYENVNQVLPIVRSLVNPDFAVNQSPNSNTLIVTDYLDNLERIGRIIESIDSPIASNIEIVRLENAFSRDVADLINKSLVNEARIQPVKPVVLADPKSNSVIIRAANQNQLSQIRSIAKQLDAASYDGNNSNIKVVYLKNAEAKQIAITLNLLFSQAMAQAQPQAQGQGQGSTPTTANTQIPSNSSTTTSSTNSSSTTPSLGLFAERTRVSGTAMVLAEETNNALIINAPPAIYRQLRNVIDMLDGRRAQVYIESLIAEVSTSKLAQLGIQWQTLAGQINQSRAIGVIGSNFGEATNGNILGLAAAAKSYSNNGKLPESLPIPQGFNIAAAVRSGGEYVLGALANFLQTQGDGNILSTPNLLTLDNEEAAIVIGQNVPILTGNTILNTGASTSPYQTFDRQDVGITLKVKPQISENGSIQMTLYQESSSIDTTSNNNQGYIINKRNIQSKVTVEDGQIIVIGGLLSDSYKENNSKVPLLGDIPLIGNLFKSKNRENKQQNLMVFIRPVIVRSAQDALNYSNEKYNMLQGLQQQITPDNNFILNHAGTPALLPPLQTKPDPALPNGNQVSLPPTNTSFISVRPTPEAPPPAHRRTTKVVSNRGSN